MKRQTLLELVDYVNTGTGKFTELVSEDIIFMLSVSSFSYCFYRSHRSKTLPELLLSDRRTPGRGIAGSIVIAGSDSLFYTRFGGDAKMLTGPWFGAWRRGCTTCMHAGKVGWSGQPFRLTLSHTAEPHLSICMARQPGAVRSWA